MVKLCLLCLATVGAERYIDRILWITNENNRFSTFPNIASYIVAPLLVMHITHACENKSDAKINAFLFLNLVFQASQRQKTTVTSYALCCLLFSFLLFLLTHRFLDSCFVLFCFFPGDTFFPGTFVNKYFNVSCFHSLHSSTFCHYFLFVSGRTYLITNLLLSVSFWRNSRLPGKDYEELSCFGLT